MMSLTLRPVLPASGLALAFLLGACEDSTAPRRVEIDDPQGLVASMRGLVGTLTNGPLVGVENVAEFGLNALDVLSRGHGTELSAVLGAQSLVMMGQRDSARTPFRQWVRRFPRIDERQFHSMGDAIDDNFYRNVYEYNPITQQYEDNGSDSGPAHGVRFVLYDVVAGTLDPATQLGTLDVEDVSQTGTMGVRVLVTGTAQQTYADYTVTLPDNGVPVSNGFDLVADGILSDGAEPMDFDLRFAQTTPRNRSVTLALVGAEEDLHFDFTDTFNPISENSHTAIDVVLNKRGESVQLVGFQDFDGDASRFTTDLTLRGNGGVFATATRDEAGFPVWEKASGDRLTQDEKLLIGTLLSGVFDSVFHSFNLMLFVLLLVA